MSAITNIIKRKPAAPLVDQLDTKLIELEDTAAEEAQSAATLAQLAAEAKAASNLASKQAVAVDKARGILLDAGVTL
ncbi:hypothetical protein PBI_ARROYO_66 [Microbacterium phage Arroyo]|uniref:hypothetical protein n=1 Tax=Microbacterium phage Arroyo TaxID=2591213 RepID=UPI0011650FF6|nr:hypothetical protein QDW24_gp66 [Microbacterium phage Arroyo]YP_010753079.1 hypothetical protein QDW28_gp65 [Microbacterium phage Albright]YP_010754046.1 hypothetical protein QDW46_gp67 [Microbacterium phage SansAfet]QDH93482.1 hypothetical protein PBI_ARROYO_66 [Microbacterium phage Arroyo]QFP94321.1 hypothetical protein SEA_SANSAFET_67 [Microbacterium phage SansAfet]QTF82240.1 hypothetical protein SEA_ALBRIGHT_65 [Microbacterium phage Albright]